MDSAPAAGVGGKPRPSTRGRPAPAPRSGTPLGHVEADGPLAAGWVEARHARAPRSGPPMSTARPPWGSGARNARAPRTGMPRPTARRPQVRGTRGTRGRPTLARRSGKGGEKWGLSRLQKKIHRGAIY